MRGGERKEWWCAERKREREREREKGRKEREEGGRAACMLVA